MSMNSSKVDLARHRLPSPGRLAELVLESSADFAVLTICLDGTLQSIDCSAIGLAACALTPGLNPICG